MTTKPQLNASNSQPITEGMKSPKPVPMAEAVLGAAGHGLASMVKTHLLRKDRVSQEQYDQRLDVCRACPDKHAVFKKDGSLYTCGPMLKSMASVSTTTNGGEAEDGPKPCGCVLSKKAVDAKETCPFGHWPTIESKPVVERREHPGEAARSNMPRILTPDRRIITPGNSGRSTMPRKGCSTCGDSSKKIIDPGSNTVTP